MNLIKRICPTIVRLFKKFCYLPQAVANAVKQRQQQILRNEMEAERLDRIRNPSKYRGK